MNDLISREALRNVILNDRKLDGSNANWEVNRILAHIDKAPTILDPNYITATDYENSFICGYRVKDLMIFGKMFHDNGIKSEDLKKYSEAYLDGYKRAYDEINAAIQKTVDSIVSKEEV